MNSNVQIHQTPIPTYDYRYSPALFNQNMAQAKAAGDQRFQAKQLDRPGMSRGRGQMAQAGIQGANALAQGIQQAYGQQTQDDAGIANMAMQGQGNQERIAQALDALNAQRNQQQQSQQQGLALSLLQGLFV